MLTTEARTWVNYCGPMVAFGVLTGVEGQVRPSLYPAVYAVKIAVVAGLLVTLRGPLRDITFAGRVLLPAVVVGAIVFFVWVGLDGWIPYPHVGSRTSFNPFESIPDPAWRAGFLTIRLLGLILVVPVMEELFLRSFVLRYATSERFTEVRPGDYSKSAFAIVAAFSAASHPEWLAAIIACVAYTLLLRYTRSLFATVVAHAVTNGALGVYVLATGAWEYW